MYDENKYPTRRFMRCTACGKVFVAGFGEPADCPECASLDVREDDGSAGVDARPAEDDTKA